MKCGGKRDTIHEIINAASRFPPLHFMLYRGKLIIYGTVYGTVYTVQHITVLNRNKLSVARCSLRWLLRIVLQLIMYFANPELSGFELR